MKQFEITLIRRINDQVKSVDKIEADDLIQLYSQFSFIIFNLQRIIHNEQMSLQNDDIPF